MHFAVGYYRNEMLHRLGGGNKSEYMTHNGAEHINTKCTEHNSPHSAILRLHINAALCRPALLQGLFFPPPCIGTVL